MRISYRPVLLLAIALAGCTKTDPLYCDEATPCDDPDRPFCDLEGEYAESEGIKRTCIADPDFSIALADDDAQVRINGELALEVTVDRKASFPADITLSVDGLPSGATADSVVIPADSSTGTILVQAADSDPGALADARVVATSGPLERTADLRLLVLGPAGTLDPTFGTLGLAGQPSGTGMDDSTLLMHLADGGFIVGGASSDQTTGVLVRFSGDGKLDESFGTAGWAEVDFDGAAVDPSGNLQLAGRADDTIVLVQGSDSGDIVLIGLTADAARDGAFGDGGVVADKVANGIVLGAQQAGSAPNGEILVAVAANTVPELIYIVRYARDGKRDLTFATDSRLELDVGDSPSVGRLSVLGDGSVLVVGDAIDGDSGRLPFVVKLTPNGLLDTGFGNEGQLVLPAGWEIGDVLVEPDGRWLVGGSIDDIPAFFRLTQTGEIDSTFGDGGALSLAVPGGLNGSVRAVLAGADDVIGAGSPDVTMARLVSDQLDSDFGVDGVGYLELDSVRAVRAVRLADGRVVVLSDNDSLPFILARFFD